MIINIKFVAIILTIASCSLVGCVSTGTSGKGESLNGHPTSISMVDSSERRHLSTRVALNDIIAFSENLTNKMLQSPVFTNSKKKPRVIVGKIKQNTHDDNLRMSDVHDRIEEYLFNTGKVTVKDKSAVDFDYIMEMELSDIIQRADDGQKQVDYMMKIKLYDKNGDLCGTWSDDLSLYKGL